MSTVFVIYDWITNYPQNLWFKIANINYLKVSVDQETRNGLAASFGSGSLRLQPTKVLTRAGVISRLQRGGVCFQAHSGYWTDSLHGQSEWRLNQTAYWWRLSSVPCHMDLSTQQLITWHFASSQWESEREEDRLNDMESRSFCSQTLEMTCHHFCYVLFVTSESLGPAQIERKEISLEYQEARITGSHFRGCLP